MAKDEEYKNVDTKSESSEVNNDPNTDKMGATSSEEQGEKGGNMPPGCCLLSTRCTRIWTFVIGCLNIIAAGSILAFNSYAIDLKITFDLTQTELELLAGAMTTCASLGYPVGLFYERFGKNTTFLISMVTGGGSLLLLFAATYNRDLYNENVWLLALYYSLYGFSTVAMYLIPMTANMRNFSSRHRGLVVGTTGACWWLGPAIFAAIYNLALVQQIDISTRNLFIILAVTFVVVLILGMIFIRDAPPDKSPYTEWTQLVPDSTTEETLVQSTGINLLKCPEFHLLTWGYLLAGVVQQMYIPNISTFATQLRLDPEDDLLTIIGPIVASVTKLTVGPLSDRTLKCGVPRAVYLLFGTALQAAVLLGGVFGVVEIEVFLITVITIYINNGIFWTIVPTLVSEFFGMRHFSRNWGLEILASSLLSWCMMETFGAVYDNRNNVHNACSGDSCFVGLFIVCCILSTVSIFFFLLLSRHERDYRRLQGHDAVPLVQ